MLVEEETPSLAKVVGLQQPSTCLKESLKASARKGLEQKTPRKVLLIVPKKMLLCFCDFVFFRFPFFVFFRVSSMCRCFSGRFLLLLLFLLALRIH